MADMHGHLPYVGDIPKGDLLLIAGDVCPVWNHEKKFTADWLRGAFTDWLHEVPFPQIVGISGNHDFVLDESKIGYELPWNFLISDSVVIDGLKIWGSPMTPKFGNWASMAPDHILHMVWDTIPEDVDILMVHGPAYMYGDTVNNDWSIDKHAGSKSLAERLENGLPNLKLFVWGHIHEAYGRYDTPGRIQANVSILNEHYEVVNEPMVFEIANP